MALSGKAGGDALLVVFTSNTGNPARGNATRDRGGKKEIRASVRYRHRWKRRPECSPFLGQREKALPKQCPRVLGRDGFSSIGKGARFLSPSIEEKRLGSRTGKGGCEWFSVPGGVRSSGSGETVRGNDLKKKSVLRVLPIAHRGCNGVRRREMSLMGVCLLEGGGSVFPMDREMQKKKGKKKRGLSLRQYRLAGSVLIKAVEIQKRKGTPTSHAL